MKKLSIIIPVFNEEKTIKDILYKVKKVKLIGNLQKEIIVVDDGSTDTTADILQKIKSIDFKYLRHKENSGKGAAVRTGISLAKGDLLIIQDADLEYNPEDYSKLLEPVIAKKAMVVYGTRLKKYPLKFWGREKTVLPLHLLANKFLTFLTNLLYGSELSDMETCYKLFDAKVLKKLKIESKRFDFEPEITAKILKMKLQIIEVPIKTNPRTYNEGKKISWIDGIMAIWTLIKYKFV